MLLACNADEVNCTAYGRPGVTGQSVPPDNVYNVYKKSFYLIPYCCFSFKCEKLIIKTDDPFVVLCVSTDGGWKGRGAKGVRMHGHCWCCVCCDLVFLVYNNFLLYNITFMVLNFTQLSITHVYTHGILFQFKGE